MAQMVERVLGKDEVTGSIPVSSSKNPECLHIRDFYLLPLTSSLLLQNTHSGFFGGVISKKKHCSNFYNLCGDFGRLH